MEQSKYAFLFLISIAICAATAFTTLKVARYHYDYLTKRLELIESQGLRELELLERSKNGR